MRSGERRDAEVTSQQQQKKMHPNKQHERDVKENRQIIKHKQTPPITSVTDYSELLLHSPEKQSLRWNRIILLLFFGLNQPNHVSFHGIRSVKL